MGEDVRMSGVGEESAQASVYCAAWELRYDPYLGKSVTFPQLRYKHSRLNNPHGDSHAYWELLQPWANHSHALPSICKGLPRQVTGSSDDASEDDAQSIASSFVSSASTAAKAQL